MRYNSIDKTFSFSFTLALIDSVHSFVFYVRNLFMFLFLVSLITYILFFFVGTALTQFQRYFT